MLFRSNPYDFPDKPMSMGGERTKDKEGMESMNNYTDVPQPTDDDSLKMQELQNAFMNDSQVREYYRKLNAPRNNNLTKSENNKNYYPSSVFPESNDTNKVLIEKLNYMINLLEEQQDQKTGNVTEEVVLYSFLGVFIIFVVDSFTKVGKYVR